MTNNQTAKKQEILALINARGGSKGIPRKNIKFLFGKPLIAYSIEAGLASRYITDLIVSTDDTEIAEVAARLGAKVPFLRPQELASDHARQIDTVLHAIAVLEKEFKKKYDAVVLLQPTAPMRTTQDIDAAIEMLLRPETDSVVSFTPVEREHPYIMYTLNGDIPEKFMKDADPGLHRQEFPKVFIRNGALYMAKRDVVVDQETFYGRNLRAYVMPLERSVNIDTPLDWEMAEFLMNRRGMGK